MYKNKLFITHFLLLVVIAVLHLTALELYWYWLFPWFDTLVHFLGGLWTALIALWFFFESGYIEFQRTLLNTAYVVGGSIFLVAIGWEIFELASGVQIGEKFVLDTSIDLIMDGLGAFVGWFYFKIVFLKNE